MFCMQCGAKKHNATNRCANCGAETSLSSTVSGPSTIIIPNRPKNLLPDGVKGWSWGAFLLNWIWAIGNRTWWGLLAIIPYIGLIVALWLGFKGREYAWKNGAWESVEHFNRVQRRWSIWALLIVVGMFGVGILAAVAIPSYQNYVERAKAMNNESVLGYPPQVHSSSGWEQKLELVAQEINGNLPEKLDSITTLNKVIAGPGLIFTYVYTLDIGANTIATGQVDVFRESVAARACEAAGLEEFFANGTTIIYQYFDKGNRRITEINMAPTYCNNRKSGQFQNMPMT